MIRNKLRVAYAAVLFLPALVLVGATVSPAAAADLPLTPYVDCVSYDAQSGIYTAYFGYDNQSTIPLSFPVGDFNTLYPGSQDQGQPALYNIGNYPRVFSVKFDNVYITSVNWELNNITATATATSPACTSGTTAPASDVTATGATLNGVVDPEGIDTKYRFEYGTTPSLGSSTATVDAGAGTRPVLAQQSLSGLTKATRYYYRIDTTNTFTNGSGDIMSFTTAPK